MDKQQATEFILSALEAGKSRQTIAQELARELNAPLTVVQKFVDQVQLPPPNMASPDKAEAIPEPVALQTAPIMEGSVRQPALDGLRIGDSQTADRWISDPEITRYIIAQLKKGRKQSDLTYEICERTGAEWSQAQRFVRQVAVEQHRAIHFRKNSWLVILGGGFIMVGLLMTIPGVILFLGLLNSNTDISSTTIPVQGSVEGLIVGVLLILGGMIGVYMAIQDQLR